MPGFTIADAQTGRSASVSDDGLLTVRSESLPFQGFNSRFKGRQYQVVGRVSSVSSGVNNILHIRNDDFNRGLVITFVRLQAIGLSGGTAIPDAATFFQLGFGETYSSGGSAVTPVNLNTGANRPADVTAYEGDPTLTGAFTEIDALYPDGASQFSYSKEGSIIVRGGDTFSVRLTTDHTSGLAYARLSFGMIELES